MGTVHVGYGSGRNSMLGKGAGVQESTGRGHLRPWRPRSDGPRILETSYLSISLDLVTGRFGKEEVQKPARDRLRSLIDERAKIVVQT